MASQSFNFKRWYCENRLSNRYHFLLHQYVAYIYIWYYTLPRYDDCTSPTGCYIQCDFWTLLPVVLKKIAFRQKVIRGFSCRSPFRRPRPSSRDKSTKTGCQSSSASGRSGDSGWPRWTGFCNPSFNWGTAWRWPHTGWRYDAVWTPLPRGQEEDLDHLSKSVRWLQRWDLMPSYWSFSLITQFS